MIEKLEKEEEFKKLPKDVIVLIYEFVGEEEQVYINYSLLEEIYMCIKKAVVCLCLLGFIGVNVMLLFSRLKK